jgi:transcriptional regulator with XRE-family HTH domain
MRYSERNVDVGVTLHAARTRAGLSQAELARRAGTSQATVSAYEGGAKQPSVATFSRLLAAAGARLTVEKRPIAEPAPADLKRAGDTLAQVIRLAEALPVEHASRLRYPRLDRRAA